MILVWVRPLCVKNAFYLQRLVVMRVKPRAFSSLCRPNSGMPKMTSIGNVSKKL